jgi:8-oxo-dGTP diphosphatase
VTSNPYESGAQKVIPAVLVYVEVNKGLLGEESQFLMLHRDLNSDSKKAKGGATDFHEGKWNGLGGKCELGESPLEAARREVKEEAGIDLPSTQLRPLGVIQFPNFKPKKSEDWLVFIFGAKLTHQPDLVPCPEGTLHWIDKSKVLALNLWPGDHAFLPFVLKSQSVMGTIWYNEGQVERTWISPL